MSYPCDSCDKSDASLRYLRNQRRMPSNAMQLGRVESLYGKNCVKHERRSLYYVDHASKLRQPGLYEQLCVERHGVFGSVIFDATYLPKRSLRSVPAVFAHLRYERLDAVHDELYDRRPFVWKRHSSVDANLFSKHRKICM